MRLWRWQAGRQQTGYEKMLLASARWPLPFDCYLLRFKPGVHIPPHVDTVTTGRHFRLNIVLRRAIAGGEFVCATPIFESTRIKLFRPDIARHEVTPVIAGTRYVFSLGWIRS